MASIEKQPNGRYKVRYRTPDGKDRAQRFDKRNEALDFAASVRVDRKRNQFVDPQGGRRRFDEYAREVMDSRLKLRPSTRARDESYLRSYVLPTFGAVPLGRIQKKGVQAWIRGLEEKGLAPRTVREAYRILGGVMREAVEDRLIAESPCRRVGLPRITRNEPRYLSPEQVEDLAAAIDDRYRALVYVGAYLGLRWGELGGLKRAHLNMLKRQVTVLGSLERVGGGHYRYVEETKTESGRRTIPLPAFLVDVLAAHLADAPESEFVFPSRNGNHLDYWNFLKRYWRPAVERAGLGPLTPHELRHTAAALMIDQGANPVTVQRRLGHKDITTTLQVYGHVFPEQDDLLTARLDDLYRGSSRVQNVSSEVVELPAQSAT